MGDEYQKRPLVVISFTKIASDVRINRHIQHLSKEFEITSIGYGPQPLNASVHIEIPSSLKYLPLSITGILRLLFNFLGRKGPRTQSVDYVSLRLAELDTKTVLINDVQCLPLIDSLDTNSVIVVDMHEYAPLEMEDDWRFRLLLKRYYTFLCATYLGRVSAVVTVSDGLAKKYSKEFGIHAEVVMNAREYVNVESEPVASNVIRLVHTGLAARSRRLENMVFAVGGLPGFSLSLYLVPGPRQKRTLTKIRKLCDSYDNCVLENPVPSSELPQVIAQYDAGFLYIHPSNFSLEHSLPNKLFDCIQARRPVIVGPSPDLSGFVEKHGVGFIAKSFEVQDFRGLLAHLEKNMFLKMKENLITTAVTVNAQSEGRKLLSIIQTAQRLPAN
jgi:hypothetical protein